MLNETECELIRQRCALSLKPATIRSATGRVVDENQRRAEHCIPDAPELEPALIKVRQAAAKACGLPPENQEPIEYAQYATGGFFGWHIDDSNNKAAWDYMDSTGGRRVWSFIVYLNDDYEGGETEFKNGLRFKGQVGEMLGFQGGQDSLHRCREITRGEKAVLLLWVREGECSMLPS